MRKLYKADIITVGFQRRVETIGNLLAFMICSVNGKNFERNAQFEKWRDINIAKKKISNVSSASFVLSKTKVHQLSGGAIGVIRVVHPEMFEFEICNENLYLLLEHTLIDHGEIKSECYLAFDSLGKVWLVNDDIMNLFYKVEISGEVEKNPQKQKVESI